MSFGNTFSSIESGPFSHFGTCQFAVVEDPALVDVGEFFGEGDGVLPVLAALQQVDHAQVQLLLALPLLLRRISVEKQISCKMGFLQQKIT